jgi:hypothetical protein
LLEYDNFHRQSAAVPVVAMTHGHYLDQLARHPRYGAALRAKPAVFLIRDPRDVAVSEFFQSTRRASGHKRELYQVEDAGSMFDFLMCSPLGMPSICEYLNHWHRELASWSHVHRLHYEQLRADPATELGRLCVFLREDFTADAIADAVAFADFDALKRKERDNYFNNNRLKARDIEDPDSYKVRRGKVGGYRDYFSAEQIERIDRFVTETLDPDLGYR